LLGAHGWNIELGIALKISDLVRRPFAGLVGTVGGGGGGACTLLGPEGPAVTVLVCLWTAGVVCWTSDRPLIASDMVSGGGGGTVRLLRTT
jgi:hypothetical protein